METTNMHDNEREDRDRVPLVKGGQGRWDTEVETTAAVLQCLLILGIAFVVVLIIGGAFL